MKDKEKIKEEIERRIDLYSIAEKDDSTFARMGELSSLIDFIDSLPEESGCEVNFTTKNEDLEEAARYYLLNNHTSPLNDIMHQANLKAEMQYHKDIEDAYKAGAERQKQKDLEDSLKSDMTMPNKFYEKGKADAMKEIKEALQTEYEKGRFDMREEMMKDAVDATIFSELKGSDGSVFQAKSDRFRMNGAKISDRIKVIPIKTEQQ